MTLDEALRIVKEKYGLMGRYAAQDGKTLYVVAARKELEALPQVPIPGSGVAIFAPEVIELARGWITIEQLVRRKNPDLFS